jgi:hypothetical protein
METNEIQLLIEGYVKKAHEALKAGIPCNAAFYFKKADEYRAMLPKETVRKPTAFVIKLAQGDKDYSIRVEHESYVQRAEVILALWCVNKQVTIIGDEAIITFFVNPSYSFESARVVFKALLRPQYA